MNELETFRSFINEVAEYDTNISSTFLRLKAKALLRTDHVNDFIIIPKNPSTKNEILSRAINWIDDDAQDGVEEAKEIVEGLKKLLDK